MDTPPQSSDPMVVEGCVSLRELARSPGRVLAEVERDGRTIAIARHGKIVALLVPLPARFVLELEGRRKLDEEATRSIHDVVTLEELDLSELARQFLVDAGSTPTGYWWVPESIRLVRSLEVTRALMQLDAAGFTVGDGPVRRLTARGRGVRRKLMQRGQGGCEPHEGLPSAGIARVSSE